MVSACGAPSDDVGAVGLGTVQAELTSPIVINEHTAGSSGWVELYNASGSSVDVSGWTVDDIVGGGTAPKVLGSGNVVPAWGWLVVSYSGLNTASADTLNLLDADGESVDSRPNGYAGSSISGLCFGRQPDGGPFTSGAIPCSQGGTNGASPPAQAAVVINEFQAGSSGWIELYNPADEAADLAGWTVDDISGGGTSPKSVGTGATIAPKGWLVVSYSGINTASADEARLLDSSGTAVDSHATFYGVDPCYGPGRCYGRIPDGGPWGPAHVPCSGGESNPAEAPPPCAPGQACDDGNACTTGDVCSSSCVCTAGAELSCDDLNPCTTDTCWPDSGCANPAAPDGLACGGGLACMGGVCGGTEPTPCVATGGTYKTVTFTRDEECLAVEFLNKARYSLMNPIKTTARDIAYDCRPASACGYRTAAWTTVAEYAVANGGSSTLTVGTSSLLALRTASATFVDDGLWYDTVAHTWANRYALDDLWVHFERVLAESRDGFCLTVRDAPGAPNYLSACIDPWYCGTEGCPGDYLEQHVGKWLSIRGRLTDETGTWRLAIKKVRAANPSAG